MCPHSPFTPNQQRLADALREAYHIGALCFEQSIDALQCTNHYGATYGLATVCMAYIEAHPVKFGRGRVKQHDFMVVCEWIFADDITRWLATHR